MNITLYTSAGLEIDGVKPHIVVNGKKVVKTVLLDANHKKFLKEISTERDYVYIRRKNGQKLLEINDYIYQIECPWYKDILLSAWNEKYWIFEKSFLQKIIFIILGAIIGYFIRYLTNNC